MSESDIPDDNPDDDPNSWMDCPACGGDGYSDEDGSSCARCSGAGGITKATKGATNE